MITGLVAVAIGFLWSLRLDATSGFADLLPSLLLLGVAFAFIYGPLTSASVEGVEESVHGVAGGIVYTGFQFGAALGISLATMVLVAGGDSTPGIDDYRRALFVPAVAAGLALLAGVLTMFAPPGEEIGSRRGGVRTSVSRVTLPLRILVTGSSGHLGEALVRVLGSRGHHVVGLDIVASPWTTHVASIADRAAVREAVGGVDAVVHSATLHKPHVDSHSKQDFIDVNVSGTLVVLEESVRAGVGRFVFTSSTTTFGRAMTPPAGAPASWITEDVVPVPRNIYGATKTAAEDLCRLFAQDHGLPVVVLRTSRFFPESDDRPDVRQAYPDTNLKTNELLYRRVDIADAVDAHERALESVQRIGFGRFIISATTPFRESDRAELRVDAPAVVRRLFPRYAQIYDDLGWRMFPSLDRIYLNTAARRDLGWQPVHDFASALTRLERGEAPFSPLTSLIGAKGYHDRPTGPYTR